MPVFALAFAASSGHVSPILPIGFVLFGIVLFIVGFLKYRRYRVLADTPQIPIRSVSMGLSHVAGTSTGGQPLISPLTQVSCYYYEVKVEKQVKRNDEDKWEAAGTGKSGGTLLPAGRNRVILVNPEKAEYNLPQAFSGESAESVAFLRARSAQS